jgi:hypothetical protein
MDMPAGTRHATEYAEDHPVTGHQQQYDRHPYPAEKPGQGVTPKRTPLRCINDLHHCWSHGHIGEKHTANPNHGRENM